jgi:hypothetical protein
VELAATLLAELRSFAACDPDVVLIGDQIVPGARRYRHRPSRRRRRARRSVSLPRPSS